MDTTLIILVPNHFSYFRKYSDPRPLFAHFTVLYVLIKMDKIPTFAHLASFNNLQENIKDDTMHR